MTGRWLTRDPVDYYNVLRNLYTYVNSDPLIYLDPMGLYAVAGIGDWWRDNIDGLRELKDYWDGVFKGERSIRQVIADSRDPSAITTVQGALGCCEFIPGTEIATAPINIALDLWNPNGGIKNACVTAACSIIPGGGGVKIIKKVTGKLPNLKGKWPTKGLPRSPRTTHPIPDPRAKGKPHSQIGNRNGRNGNYKQAREWGKILLAQ